MCKRRPGREQKAQKFPLFFLVWRCLGPLAPTRFTRWHPFKGCHLQKLLDWIDLDIPEKILTFCF